MKFNQFLRLKEKAMESNGINESIDSNTVRSIINEYVETVGSLDKAIAINEAEGFLDKIKGIIAYGTAMSKLGEYESEYEAGGNADVLKQKEALDVFQIEIKKVKLEGQKGDKVAAMKDKLQDQKDQIMAKSEVKTAKAQENWRQFKEEWDELVDKVQGDQQKVINKKVKAIEAAVAIKAKEQAMTIAEKQLKIASDKKKADAVKLKLDKLKKEVSELGEKEKTAMAEYDSAMEDADTDPEEMKTTASVLEDPTWKTFEKEKKVFKDLKDKFETEEKTLDSDDSSAVDAFNAKGEELARQEVTQNIAYNNFRTMVEGLGDKSNNTLKSLAGLPYEISRGSNKGKKIDDRGELPTEEKDFVKKYTKGSDKKDGKSKDTEVDNTEKIKELKDRIKKYEDKIADDKNPMGDKSKAKAEELIKKWTKQLDDLQNPSESNFEAKYLSILHEMEEFEKEMFA